MNLPKLKTENLILCGLIVLVIPFLLLCFFTHPQNDDFNYSLKTIRLGYLGANIHWYKFWSGRYFATALLSMNPLVFRDFGIYKLVTTVTIILVLYAFYFFVSQIFSTILNKKKIVIISLALFILYLARMPSLVGGLYFMASAVTYQSGNILFLIICGYLLKIRKSSGQQQRRTLMGLILSALIFASAGSNEVTMLLTLEICALSFLLDCIANRRMNALLAMAASTSIISTAIVVLAPGTSSRYSTTQHLDFFSALQSSLTCGVSQMAYWLISAPLLPIGILVVPVLFKWLAGRKVLPFTIPQGWFLIVTFIMYISLFFPSFYATGHVETRTVNVIYLFFLISVFFNIVIVINNATIKEKELRVFSSRIGILTLCALIFIMFIVPHSNVKAAISDLVTGSAYYYDRELKKRYQIINHCTNRQGDMDPYAGKGEDSRHDIQQADNEMCQVPPLKHTPKSIYFDEMALDPRKNESENVIRYKLTYAYYFKRSAIILNYDME